METGFAPCGCFDGYLLDPLRVCPDCGGEGVVSVDWLATDPRNESLIESINQSEEAA